MNFFMAFDLVPLRVGPRQRFYTRTLFILVVNCGETGFSIALVVKPLTGIVKWPILVFPVPHAVLGIFGEAHLQSFPE